MLVRCLLDVTEVRGASTRPGTMDSSVRGSTNCGPYFSFTRSSLAKSNISDLLFKNVAVK